MTSLPPSNILEASVQGATEAPHSLSVTPQSSLTRRHIDAAVSLELVEALAATFGRPFNPFDLALRNQIVDLLVLALVPASPLPEAISGASQAGATSPDRSEGRNPVTNTEWLPCSKCPTPKFCRRHRVAGCQRTDD